MGREIETDRFLARTDMRKEYIIIQYQEYISSASFGDHHVELGTLKSLRTSTGLHVKCIDPKTFQIVETNEIVRKV